MNKITFLTSATVLALSFSCKESNDIVPENKEPNATITVESESETLWNQVKVVVTASDADGAIASVDLYADEQLVGSDAEAPYEFEWNTKEHDDGTVQLKAVVKDDLEATAESVKDVEVLNTLLDYQLYEGYLAMSPDYKYFTYITSKSKQVLYFEQIESLPYEAKVVRPDDFDDAEFDVHFVYANPTLGNLVTYSDFTPGVFAPLNPDMRGGAMGETNVFFGDIPAHDHFTFSSYGGSPLMPEKAYKVPLYENLNIGYLYLRNGDEGLYKIIQNLEEGDEDVSLSATGFQMEPHNVKIEGFLDGFNMNVYGHTGPEADAPAVKLFGHFKFGEMDGYEVSYHTPDIETIFDHYSTFMSVSDAEKSYIQENYFGIINMPIKLNVDFQVQSHKLSEIDFSVSGDDHDVLISSYSVIHDGFVFVWESHSKDEDVEFPVLPGELTGAAPKFTNSNLVFKEASIYLRIRDYDHLEGYGDYMATLSGRTGKTMKEGGGYNASVGQTFNP